MLKTTLLLLALLAFFSVLNYFVSKAMKKKNALKHFKLLAEKYGLVVDESNKIGSTIYPLAKGVYKNRQIGIGCFINQQNNKKETQTYLRVECSNPKNISFGLRSMKKNNSGITIADRISLMDREFDEKFIVMGSSPDKIIPIFSFNIKYSLLQAYNLTLKGNLKLEGNLLDYTENGLMDNESAQTRIELLMHILCDISDELRKH